MAIFTFLKKIGKPHCKNKIDTQDVFKKNKLKSIATYFIAMLFLFYGNILFSQTILTETTVKANFGIDADVHSGVVSFTPIWPTPFGTDDWFDGDSGQGVIDETDPQGPLLLTTNNASAEIRMKVPIYTVVDGRLWIDAVFLRDQNTNAGNKDSNVFTGGNSDKNFDNPSTWTINNGDVPQKNDIIDVYGHLRREGNTINTDQWALIGASTRNADGDSYLDFEYFRSRIELINNVIVSETDMSATGGHTAYLFDSVTGGVLQHGDIIMSVNYANGGVNVIIKLYVWVELDGVPDSFFDAQNNKPARPFEFVKDGNNYVQHFGGDMAQGYGYAQIQLRTDLPSGLTAIFTQVNDGGTVPAGPWGTIEKGGSIASDYDALTFAEIAVNSTALGFDSSSSPGIDCISPLGSVIVKTRSSDSFTSELKDLAGPFNLGDTPEVTVTLEGDDIECTEESEILTATASPNTGNTYAYKWFQDGVEVPDETEHTLVITEAGTYTVEATLVFSEGVFGCTATSEDLVINLTPLIPLEINCPQDEPIAECTSQEDINTAFTTWKNDFSHNGGNGTITATYSINGETIDISTLEAPEACIGGSITVKLTVADECEQMEMCESTFSVIADDIVPEIVDLQDYKLDTCNEEWPAVVETTWTDNCADGGTIQATAGDVVDSQDGCMQSRLYTFTVTDDCGNDATETVTISRDYDMTDPTIADIDDYKLDTCNEEWPAVVETTWTDNCADGGTIQATAGDVVDSQDGCMQSRLYTFTVTDDCGNDATETVTISRDYDMTDPTIADIDDYKLDTCNEEWPAVVETTWTDNCADGGTIQATAGDVVDSQDGCMQSRLYTFTVTDDCGNDATETVTISRDYDMTDPTIADIDDYKLDTCNEEWPAVVETTWTDNCADGGTIQATAGDVVDSQDGCMQSRLYTFTVTDDCGNDATETVTISRDYDMTDPTIADIDDYKLDTCNEEWPAVVETTWTDNCADGGTIQATAGDVVDSQDGCMQSRLYTFTVTDDCGNDATETVTISRDYDMTDPTIADIDDYKLDTCNEEWPAVVETTWTDNCADGGTIQATAGDVVDSQDGCMQSRLYTFTVTDDCGNDATETVTISRDYDMTDPTIADIDDYKLDTCNEEWPAVVETTWTDNCAAGGTIQATAGDVVDSQDGCMQSRLYTFTVTDDCGNDATETVTISRDYDMTDPTIADIDDYKLDTCNEEWPAVVETTWTDNCADGGTIQATAGDVVDSQDGCMQSRLYTFTVTDDCGNDATETVTISRDYDMTDPTIADIDDYKLDTCNEEWPAVVETTWTDNCADGGTIQATAGDVVDSQDGCMQSRLYTFTVTDDCGNDATETVTISRDYDMTDPTIADIDDYKLDTCNEEWPAVVETTWTDNCADGGTIQATAGDVVDSQDGCMQSRLYTFTVTDDCGNDATETVTISRDYDMTDPTIADIDDYKLDTCNEEWPAVVETTWTDNCADGGTIQATAGDVVDSQDGCMQSRLYTFTVTDDCGNDATETVTISRDYDMTDPTIADIDDYKLDTCNEEWPAVVETTWTDNCAAGGTIQATAGDVVDSQDGCMQSRLYTFTVTDDCGNDATETVTISRDYDMTDPTIADIDDYKLDTCNEEWPAVVETTWTDNCAAGGTIQATAGDVVDSQDGCMQSRLYTFTVTDDCGNDATETVTISRDYDMTDPTIADIDDYKLDTCNEEWPAVVETTWTDNCADGGTIQATAGDVVDSQDGCMQSRLYTFTVTDDCGNDATETVTISRDYDMTDPTIADIDDYKLDTCNEEWPAVVETTWTDNCADGGTIQATAGDVVDSQDGCMQSRLYTFTVTDDCGNDATETVTISRDYDMTDPTIADIDDYKLDTCNEEWPAVVETTWTDNCADGGTIQATAGDVVDSQDGCMQSRLYTFTVTDDCGNDATETVTISRDYDMTDPTIADIDDYKLNTCNEEWPAVVETTWTDNCADGGTIQATAGDVVDSQDGCMQSRLYTFTVTDDCGNDATETVTISRDYDMTDPVILNVEDYTICNEDFPETLTRNWTDNCSEGGVVESSVGDINDVDECSKTREYTFTVTDDCANTTTETVIITREIDKVENCETAFARLNDDSQCFIGNGFKRWGWTNYIEPSETTYEMPLYAGAAHCDITKGALVGQVNVTYFDGDVSINYIINDGYVMSEAHVYAGCNQYPTNKKGKETVAPGKYTFNAGNLDNSTGISVNFTNVEGGIWFIAHAVVCEETCRCSDRPGPDDGNEYDMNLDINCQDNPISQKTENFKAYPVPFDEILNVEYKYEYDTDVRIQIFDTKGMLIISELDKNYTKGEIKSKQLDMSRIADQSLIIRLSTNQEVTSKLVVSKSVKRKFK